MLGTEIVTKFSNLARRELPNFCALLLINIRQNDNCAGLIESVDCYLRIILLSILRQIQKRDREW